MSRLSASCVHALARTAGRPAIAAARPIVAACPAMLMMRSPHLASACAGSVFARAYNVNGNEVKTGSIIKHEGKSFVVLGTTVNMRGRAHTTYNLELKNVANGSKISVRVRAEDKVDVVELQSLRMNYLYRQGNTLFFMDPATFEQIELDASLADRDAAYLIENSSTVLVRDGETFVQVRVPEKVVCTVESTTERVRVNDAGGKEAKLTNGLTITVPNHVEKGQHIVVNTTTNTFSAKSDTPPEPEVEKTY